MDKSAPMWRKVFEIVDWSGRHIIRFSGWQSELRRELEEWIDQANGWREALQKAKEENGLLRKRVAELEEEGRKAEGMMKRKLQSKEEACKRKLIKLAESFVGPPESATEVEDEDQTENEGPPAGPDQLGGQGPDPEPDDVSVIPATDQEEEEDENRLRKKVTARTRTAGQPSGEKNLPRKVSKPPTVRLRRELEPVPESPEPQPEPVPTGRGPGGQRVLRQPQPPLRSIGNESRQQAQDRPLTQEQQSLFKLVIGGCLSSVAARQCHALERLSNDPQINGLLPKLAPFISDGIDKNEEERNLKKLPLLLRMLRNLLNNHHVNLGEAQVTQLSNSVMSCVTSPFGSESSNDAVWRLRDRAALLLGRIYRRSPNDSINVHIRTTLKSFISSDQDQDQASLGSLYGAIAALVELGDEDAKDELARSIEAIGDRLESCSQDGDLSEDDKVAVANIHHLILKAMPPLLMSSWSPPDRLKEYNEQLGSYFGKELKQSVIKLRRRTVTKVQPTRHSLRDRGQNNTYSELYDD